MPVLNFRIVELVRPFCFAASQVHKPCERFGKPFLKAEYLGLRGDFQLFNVVRLKHFVFDRRNQWNAPETIALIGL
jgi:hypothetical protein